MTLEIAKELGRLFRSGKFCTDGWKKSCNCGMFQSDFCRAKLKFVELAKDRDPVDPDDPFYVIKIMHCSEFYETGLVLIIEHPTFGRIRVKDFSKFVDFVYSPPEEQAAKIIEAHFPGSRRIS